MAAPLPARRIAAPPSRVLTPSGRRASPRSRRGWNRTALVASFLLLCVLPSLAGVLYFGVLASGQYVAEARFTLRPAAPPGASMVDVPARLIVQDTLVAMSYLQSRALVETLDKDVDLRRLYSKNSIDGLSRLGPDAKIEAVVRYWTRMSTVSVQPKNGIVTLTVRAFSPDDAVKIAEACLKATEAEVNRLDAQVVTNTSALVALARKTAESNLAAARAGLEATRNRESVLDSEHSTSALTELITSVRKDYLQLQQQYETQIRYLNRTAPTIRNLQVRLAAAKHEIAKLEAQQTAQTQGRPSSPVLSSALAQVEYATLQNRVAEAQYATAVSQLEAVHIASNAKSIYLETFLRPAAAQEAKYPHRVLWSVVSVAGSVAAWLALVWGVSRGLRRV